MRESSTDPGPAEFIKTMNAIADGTPRDVKGPTDDTTFERKSRELVKLYRYISNSLLTC